MHFKISTKNFDLPDRLNEDFDEVTQPLFRVLQSFPNMDDVTGDVVLEKLAHRDEYSAKFNLPLPQNHSVNVEAIGNSAEEALRNAAEEARSQVVKVKDMMKDY